MAMDYSMLPGGDLVRGGIEDLRAGIESPQALLVAIGRPRLSRLGVSVPDHPFAVPERRLYEHLSQADPDTAHPRYNALIRRLVSFERAAAKAVWPVITMTSTRKPSPRSNEATVKISRMCGRCSTGG